MPFRFGRQHPASPATSYDGEKQPNDAIAQSEIRYDDDLHVQCPPHTTDRKLMRRIDFHVIPFLCILYLLAFLDRVNISNARVYGLPADLGLTGDQYNVALVIFFVPYILFEIPSNILLKKFSPNVWLSLNMALFGFATIMQGVVKNYSGLLATRFFLGLFETGMFPGCFYLIGMWYRRQEAGKRFSFFFSSTTLAGAFGGLIAAGIRRIDGARGIAAWRWIFIIEGAITVAVGIIFYFILPSFPEQAKWLSVEERAYVAARLRKDQGNSAVERPVGVKDVINVFKDYKVIVAGFMYFGLIVPAYGYAYFAPSIIQTYGYSPVQTQLHSVPPWAAAFGFAMLLATFSDRFKHRMFFAMGGLLIAIAGFAILLSVHNNTSLEYAALFLVTMGIYGVAPLTVCWFNMNLGGHHRRAIGSAWQIAFGNIGGIIATFAFLSKDAPKYITGYAICIAFSCITLLSCTIYGAACWAENRQRDRLQGQSGLTEEEKTELGDKSPDYRYML